MSRLKLFIFVASLWLAFSPQYKTCARGVGIAKADELRGVYEFVSRTGEYTGVRNYTTHDTSSEWDGLWIFEDGFYSSVLMKKGRKASYDPKDLDYRDYESYTGTYKIDGKYIAFKLRLALSTVAVGGTDYMEYRLQGDTLTLIQVLSSHGVDLNKGKITTVLRLVK
jgi:hypothetical protein